MNVQTEEPSVIDSQTAHVPAPAPAAPAHLRRLVLTGFMGAGKTTVGRLLAERLGWEFLDLDAFVEARTGLAVPAIFAQHGERHFRKLESQALVSALGRDHIVLALGGGAPEVLTNRLLLEQTPATAIIFLDAPFPVLYNRCLAQALNSGADNPAQMRPNLADMEAAQARCLARQPIYRRLAHHTIDTESLTTEGIVAALHSNLSQPQLFRRRTATQV